MDNLTVSLGTAPLPQGPRMAAFKVEYPTGTTPYFTGAVNGFPPSANATLQASTDLGRGDSWQNLITIQANTSGSLSFLNVPDPSAAGSRWNFYRVVTQ